MSAPLDGIRILDFSTLLPGPMATLFLAEAGAEVIKIERPGGGEEMRNYQPRWGAESAQFAFLNRAKKSLALDLKDESAKRTLQPLIEEADVLVEQFRPGVMARLGLDYAAVSKINPRIIYCSITGYGQSGPKRDAAGHDLNYIGDTGLLSLSMGSAEQYVVPPALIADIGAGTYPAVFNILLALRARDTSGEGCYLDIAMTDNLFPFLYWALANGQTAGEWPGNGTGRVTGGSPRYQLYPTADGRVAAVAALEQKFWEAFTDAIGLDAKWCDDARDPEGTRQAVAVVIRGQTSEYWIPLFATADSCCTIVKTVREALDDPHFAARGLFAERLANESGRTVVAVPVPVAPQFRAALGEALHAPSLGAHNDELLKRE